MPRPPHVEKILKLLVLSGTGNPSAEERAVAREKAEALMERHGLTREQMRELYRQDHGLPPRPQRPASADPLEQQRLRREAAARAEAAQAAATRARLARAQAEREQAARDREERAALTTRLRAAILLAVDQHPDFADFLDALAALGIQVSVPAEDAVERLVYRWPPGKVAVPSADLGTGCDWPSLLGAGLRFDPRAPRHREALALLFLG